MRIGEYYAWAMPGWPPVSPVRATVPANRASQELEQDPHDGYRAATLLRRHTRNEDSHMRPRGPNWINRSRFSLALYQLHTQKPDSNDLRAPNADSVTLRVLSLSLSSFLSLTLYLFFLLLVFLSCTLDNQSFFSSNVYPRKCRRIFIARYLVSMVVPWVLMIQVYRIFA